MKHPKRVHEYLEHIAESLDRATVYVQHLEDLAAFQQDPRSQDAVLHNIAIG